MPDVESFSPGIAEGPKAGAEGTASARVDGGGMGKAPQDGRGESEDGSAFAGGDGDDAGLDCRPVANGLQAYAGQLLEKMTDLTIAGTDPFYGTAGWKACPAGFTA